MNVTYNIYYIHTNIIQPYKGSKILTHATTWMNLENIMMSEFQNKDNHWLSLHDSTHLNEESRAVKFTEVWRSMVVARVGEKGKDDL